MLLHYVTYCSVIMVIILRLAEKHRVKSSVLEDCRVGGGGGGGVKSTRFSKIKKTCLHVSALYQSHYCSEYGNTEAQGCGQLRECLIMNTKY